MMPDREKVIENLERMLSNYDMLDDIVINKNNEMLMFHRAVAKAALELLKEQPQIVRCKDCKWWDKKPGSPYGYCHACKHGYSSPNWEIGIYRTYEGDWFCAEGERRDNG